MSKCPFSLPFPPPLSFFSCSSLTGTICQRRGYLRAAKRTKKKKKRERKERQEELRGRGGLILRFDIISIRATIRNRSQFPSCETMSRFHSTIYLTIMTVPESSHLLSHLYRRNERPAKAGGIIFSLPRIRRRICIY